MHRFFALLVAFLIAGGIAPTRIAQATDPCYPGSTLPAPCLTGQFQQFWEQNGGLPVFGLPITLVSPEVNPDTGQSYQTQWFERNRFELHPDFALIRSQLGGVLLGRLGDERLRQLGRDWHSEPHASGPKADCLWFPATQHNVCDQGFPYAGQGFKSYWQTHGLQLPSLSSEQRSVALFGLPLTEPAMETNSSGDTVLTQWFERARFEWHPDKPDPYKVLLGRLGAELRAPTPVVSSPAPVPAAPTATPAPVPPQPTPGTGMAVPATGCSQNAPAVADGAQAWVTVPRPPQNGTETVCGRLTTSNTTPLAGVTATIGVHYPALDAFTDGVTDTNGEVAVRFPAGPLTNSIPITVDVEFATGQHATTSFTPQ